MTKTISIKAKQGGVTVASAFPPYKYYLKKKGVILKVPAEHAKKLLQNPDLFEKVGETSSPDKEPDLDLNRDGVFDDKDKSIAGKALRKPTGETQ